MYQIVYVSSCTRALSRAELADLLDHARAKNERLGITGMLLYRDGDFMQALEGQEAGVRALMETIGKDPRHHGIVCIVEHEIEARRFSDWSMGFHEVGEGELRRHAGFTDVLKLGFVEAERADPGIALRLLTTFSQG